MCVCVSFHIDPTLQDLPTSSKYSLESSLYCSVSLACWSTGLSLRGPLRLSAGSQACPGDKSYTVVMCSHPLTIIPLATSWNTGSPGAMSARMPCEFRRVFFWFYHTQKLLTKELKWGPYSPRRAAISNFFNWTLELHDPARGSSHSLQEAPNSSWQWRRRNHLRCVHSAAQNAKAARLRNFKFYNVLLYFCLPQSQNPRIQ